MFFLWCGAGLVLRAWLILRQSSVNRRWRD